MPSKHAFLVLTWAIVFGFLFGCFMAFTATANADTVPLGITPGVGADSNGANVFAVTGPFTALTSGTINRIAMYTTGGTTQMTYGLYADSGGTMATGAPLCTTSGVNPAAGGGWCLGTLNGSGTCAITAGTRYWFGAHWSGSVTYKLTSQANGMYYKTVTYSGGTLPTVPSGMTAYGELISMLAFVGPSVAPPTSAVLTTSGGTIEGVAYTGLWNKVDPGYVLSTGTMGLLASPTSGTCSVSGSDCWAGSYGSKLTGTLVDTPSLRLTTNTMHGVAGLWNTVTQGNVLTSGTYGLSASPTSGTYNVTQLSATNVLTGTSWGVSLANSGTLTSGGTLNVGYILAGHVLTGSGTGTLTLPPVAGVMATAGSWGYAGTGSTGTLAIASSDVWSGVVAYSTTGTLSIASSDVWTGVTIHGATVGTLAISASNIRYGVVVHGTTGTCPVPGPFRCQGPASPDDPPPRNEAPPESNAAPSPARPRITLERTR